jgi:hypothetical protein
MTLNPVQRTQFDVSDMLRRAQGDVFSALGEFLTVTELRKPPHLGGGYETLAIHVGNLCRSTQRRDACRGPKLSVVCVLQRP